MNRYDFVTHLSSTGSWYKVLERIDEPMRIHPAHIYSVVYIYRTQKEAEEAVEDGASGFVIGVLKASNPDTYFTYIVTNVHVIGRIIKEKGTPTIRINTEDKKSTILSIPESAWKYHPDGDDIAMCQVELPDNVDTGLIEPYEFITPELLKPESWHIGPGDSTYMVGRFLNHGGKSLNTPTVRYGNIALNPDIADKVHNPLTGHDDEVFLIESRSINGYSGSPVFVFIPPYDNRSKPKPKETQHTFVIMPPRVSTNIYFLGMDIGHTRTFKNVVLEKNGEREPVTMDDSRLQSEYNTGIMRITPAWKIKELLDHEDFTMVRKQDAEIQQKEVNDSHTLDSTPPNEKLTHDFTREEFMSKLKKVSRKIKPEKK